MPAIKKQLNALFITGTGTDVGKTVISSLLLGFLLRKGLKAGYQKWVSTGGEMPGDLLYCFNNNKLPFREQDIDKHVMYRFSMAASPHLAAEREAREFDADRVKKNFYHYALEKDFVLVEGVGGVMVPLRRDLLLADFLVMFQMPVLVVAKSGLGTINHTLLTLESLKRRGVYVLGIIFSDEQEDMDHDDLLISDNMRTIAEMGEVDVFGRLAHLSNYVELEAVFESIGEKIWKKLF